MAWSPSAMRAPFSAAMSSRSGLDVRQLRILCIRPSRPADSAASIIAGAGRRHMNTPAVAGRSWHQLVAYTPCIHTTQTQAHMHALCAAPHLPGLPSGTGVVVRCSLPRTAST